MTSIEIPTYPTSWAGDLTFDAIYTDLEDYAYGTLRPVCHLAYEQLREAVQNGFIALFKQLQDDPRFLTTHTRKSAVYFMAARCGSSFIKKRDRRTAEQAHFDDLWQHPDTLHHITGLEAGAEPGERHAAFAARVDFQVDFACVIQRLADRYANSTPHLVALYACTTQVTFQQAASLLQNYKGGGWTGFQQLYATVQGEVRAALAEAFHEQPAGDLLSTPLKPLQQRAPRQTQRNVSVHEKTIFTTLTRLHETTRQPITARMIFNTLESVSITAVRETLLRLEKRGAVRKEITTAGIYLWMPVPTFGTELLAAPVMLPRLGDRHVCVYHALAALMNQSPYIPLTTLHTTLPDYSIYTLRRALCDLEAHGLARRTGAHSATKGWSPVPINRGAALPIPLDIPALPQAA